MARLQIFKEEEHGDMSFLQHLEALRWHLVRAAIAVIVCAIAAFLLKGFIFDIILFGPKHNDFLTYRALCKFGNLIGLGNDLCISEIGFKLQNISLAGQFTMHMTSSIIAGFIFASPYVFWELWRFIKPALHDSEKRYARGLVFYISFLFITGVLFGYYVITPLSVNFLGSYQVSPEVINVIGLDSYVSVVTTMTLMSGAVFELPVIVYFLTKIGLVTPAFMRKYRRHAFVFSMILAAVITPTSDIPTMLVVTAPIYILFEVSIFVSAKALPQPAEGDSKG